MRAESLPMKPILTIVLLLAAMMAVKSTQANSQDVCTPKYVSCIDSCVTKKGPQDQCIASCQQKNNDCAAGVYGATSSPEVVSAEPAKQPDEATDGASTEAPAKSAKPRKKSEAKAPTKASEAGRREVR
jgi:hypothetical protein